MAWYFKDCSLLQILQTTLIFTYGFSNASKYFKSNFDALLLCWEAFNIKSLFIKIVISSKLFEVELDVYSFVWSLLNLNSLPVTKMNTFWITFIPVWNLSKYFLSSQLLSSNEFVGYDLSINMVRWMISHNGHTCKISDHCDFQSDVSSFLIVWKPVLCYKFYKLL